MVKRKFWGTSFKGFRNLTFLTWAWQYIPRISDTAGQEVYENVRLLAYPGTDVLIIAFDIMARKSFDNITETWIKDKNKHMKNAKVGKNMSKVKVIILNDCF